MLPDAEILRYCQYFSGKGDKLSQPRLMYYLRAIELQVTQSRSNTKEELEETLPRDGISQRI